MNHNRQIAQSPSRLRLLCLALLPLAAFGMLLAVKTLYAEFLMPHIPPCMLRSLTGWLCPSCGMTHAVFALSRLDLVTALRENIMIPFAVLLAVLWYAEKWCAVCGHPKRLIPRKKWFWIGVLLFWLLYTILRNLIPI